MNHDKGKERNKGSVSIEATIALTAFLFMFIMIYSIISVCRAQATIQIAINQTAKEISQYSYVYGLTGLDATLNKFQKEAEDEKKSVNDALKNVAGVFDGIQSLKDSTKKIDISNMDSVLKECETVGNGINQNAEELKQKLEKIAEDPQKFIFGMAKIIGSEKLEEGKSKLIAVPIARALVKQHLKRNEQDNANSFCASIGITPDTYLGKKTYFNGLNFSDSNLFKGGSNNIEIVVSYKIKLPSLLPIDKEFNITQRAVANAWLHGDLGNKK